MMRIRTIMMLMAMLLGVSPVITMAQSPVQRAAAPIPSPPALGANSYVLMDFNSQRVLVDQESGLQVEPASITKLMTSYVVFHELASGNMQFDEVVTISEKAWKTEGSRMFVEPDTRVTVEELVKGMVVQSGNDASVALAEHVAGSEAAFAGLMNHYAEQLGMKDTNFVNATGLPDASHYTTAYDVALLSMALIRDFPDYYALYSEKEYTYNNIRQHNRNTLLWRDPAVDGLKTGHTESAGYCLASSAKRDGMRLISVVMGAASENARASDSQSLLNYGFRFYETMQLYQAGESLAETRVWKGEEDQVALGLNDPLFVTIPRGQYDALDARVEMASDITAPLQIGDVIGRINITLGEELVASRDLVALQSVEPAGFFGRSWDGMRLWFGGLFDDDDE